MKNSNTQKDLLISIIANLIALVTSFGVSFLLTPYLINNIGKEAYSFFPIANNFVSYMTIITIALNSMASRFITITFLKKEYTKAKQYYSSVFLGNVILSIFMMVPMIVTVLNLEKILNIPEDYLMDVKVLFTLVFLSMIINTITSVFETATYIRNRMELKAYKDIIQGLLKSILFLTLFALFSPSLVYLGYVSIFLSISNFIISYSYAVKLVPELRVSKIYFKFSFIKTLLFSGIWNSINALSSVLLFGVSLLLANILLGADAGGDLSIAQTLPNLMTTVITTICSVFLPRLTYTYVRREDNNKRFIAEIDLSQKVLSIISCTPVIMIILFGKDFFSLWVPAQNIDELYLLSTISILGLWIHGNMWTINGLTTINNTIKVPACILCLFGLINVVLIIILVKEFSFGIMIIPLVGLIINIIYYLIFCLTYISKKLKIPIKYLYKNIFMSFAFTACMLSLGFYLKKYIEIKSWINFFWYVIPISLFTMVMNFMFFYFLSKNSKNQMKKIGELWKK